MDEAAEAEATILPAKLTKKLVAVPTKVPDLPMELVTQLCPKLAMQAVLAVALGLLKSWPRFWRSGVTTL